MIETPTAVWQRLAEIVARPPGGVRLVSTPAGSAGVVVPAGLLAALDDLLGETSDDAFRAAVATRALRALSRVLGRVKAPVLAGAASAATDRDALIAVLLAEPEMDAILEADPLAQARLRGDRVRQSLLVDEGGTIGVTEVAERLHLTRQAVTKRRLAGRLLAVATGRHGYRYPVWQFAAEGLLPGIQPVLAILVAQGHDSWTQMAFFLNDRSDLDGQRPLDLLRTGAVETVVTSARRLGEHGAI